jgi:hypothetical protein
MTIKTPHILKLQQPFFEQVKIGMKQFELRRNDRDYQVGDTCFLREYDALHNSYSGDALVITITYILEDRPGLLDYYCIFGFNKPQLVHNFKAV